MPTSTHPSDPTTTPVPSPLRGTGFGRLWACAGAGNLADGLLLAGLPVLATTVTDRPAAIAGVTVALMLPMVLTALPAGVLADRGDRRRILVGGNLGRALVLGVLLGLVALVELRLAVLYLVAVAASSSEVLVDTTAQVAVPGMVPDDRLEGANARIITTQVVTNQAVGAPLGAALAAVGAAALLAPSVALYALAAVAATRLRLRGRAERAVATTSTGEAHATGRPVRVLLADVREGLVHLATDRILRAIAAAACLANIGNTAFVAILVLYVTGPLQLPASAYGLVLACVAVGGLVGGAIAERVLRRTGPALAMRIGFAVQGLVYLVLALAPRVAVVGAGAALLGVTLMLINVTNRSLRQRLVPPALLGRVTASFSAVALLATPLGAVIGGVVAEWFGVRAVAGLAAATSAFALLLLGAVTTRSVSSRVVTAGAVGPRADPSPRPA